MQDVVENPIFLFSFEWWVATKQNVHDDAETPHIALLCVISFQNFGRHIEWRSHNSVHMVLLVTLEEPLTQAKVNQFNL